MQCRGNRPDHVIADETGQYEYRQGGDEEPVTMTGGGSVKAAMGHGTDMGLDIHEARLSRLQRIAHDLELTGGIKPVFAEA